jgi:hypothetical protein
MPSQGLFGSLRQVDGETGNRNSHLRPVSLHPNATEGVVLMTVAAATPLATAPTKQDARKELARYFQIADLAQRAPEMFSAFIDAEWHRLLESKGDYSRFCLEAVGHMVGHQEGTGYGVVTWVELYHQRFGTLPGAWFASAEGVVDVAAYESYLDGRANSHPFKCSTGAPPPCEVGNPPALRAAFARAPRPKGNPGVIRAWDCTPTTRDPDLKPKVTQA